jgi:hypothetical protein
MPRLKWLMFQMPMSSPQRIRMFGFFAAMMYSFHYEKMNKPHANNESLSASNAIERNNGFNTLLLVQQRTKRIEAIWHALHGRCGSHHCV